MVRVLSFQSVEVVEQLLSKGVYTPNPELARKKGGYSKDVEQLGGENPIWCFVPNGGKFAIEEFQDGTLFEHYRCQMYLDSLAGTVLLEVEVPEKELRVGLTHNSYCWSQVFSTLTVDRLCAIYSITDTRSCYYVDVQLVKAYKEEVLFPEGLATNNVRDDKVQHTEFGKCTLKFDEMPPRTLFNDDERPLNLDRTYTVKCAIVDGVPIGTPVLGSHRRSVDIEPHHVVPGSITVLPNEYATVTDYSRLLAIV